MQLSKIHLPLGEVCMVKTSQNPKENENPWKLLLSSSSPCENHHKIIAANPSLVGAVIEQINRKRREKLVRVCWGFDSLNNFLANERRFSQTVACLGNHLLPFNDSARGWHIPTFLPNISTQYFDLRYWNFIHNWYIEFFKKL